VHDAIDPELERGLGRVGHVLGVAKDFGTCRRIGNDDGELVASARLQLARD